MSELASRDIRIRLLDGSDEQAQPSELINAYVEGGVIPGEGTSQKYVDDAVADALKQANQYTDTQTSVLETSLKKEITDSADELAKTKQDKLVQSGKDQNIKTINGQDILGAGDIKIEDNTSVISSDESVNVTKTLDEYDLSIEATLAGYQAKLDSTNLKTINGKSLLGGGDIEIVEDKELESTDNSIVIENDEETGKINLTVSQTLLNTKQDKLVSDGDNQNIKTINGETILGKGDITLEVPDSILTYKTFSELQAVDQSQLKDGTQAIVLQDETHDGSLSIYTLSKSGYPTQEGNILVGGDYLFGLGEWAGYSYAGSDSSKALLSVTPGSDPVEVYLDIAREDLNPKFHLNQKYSLQIQGISGNYPSTIEVRYPRTYDSGDKRINVPTDGTNINLPALQNENDEYGLHLVGSDWDGTGAINVRLYPGEDHASVPGGIGWVYQGSSESGSSLSVDSSWKPNTDYVQGQIVENNGTLYVVTENFTSGTTFDSTKLQVVSGKDSRLTDSGAERANNLTQLMVNNINVTDQNPNTLGLEIGVVNLESGSSVTSTVNLPVATNESAGIMTASDKAKLNDIPAIKSIGDNLTLDENGKLSATGGSGNTLLDEYKAEPESTEAYSASYINTQIGNIEAILTNINSGNVS